MGAIAGFHFTYVGACCCIVFVAVAVETNSLVCKLFGYFKPIDLAVYNETLAHTFDLLSSSRNCFQVLRNRALWSYVGRILDVRGLGCWQCNTVGGHCRDRTREVDLAFEVGCLLRSSFGYWA